MKFSDINASRKQLIRSLRHLTDAGKRRVIVGVSAICMVLVLALWVRSLERLVPALAEESGTSTTTDAPRAASFLHTLSLGVQSISSEFGARWQSTKDRIGPLLNSIEAQVNGGNTYVITPAPTSTATAGGNASTSGATPEATSSALGESTAATSTGPGL